jgi:hypothetical protein
MQCHPLKGRNLSVLETFQIVLERLNAADSALAQRCPWQHHHKREKADECRSFHVVPSIQSAYMSIGHMLTIPFQGSRCPFSVPQTLVADLRRISMI